MWAVHLEWILRNPFKQWVFLVLLSRVSGASGCHGSRSFRESCLDHCAPALFGQKLLGVGRCLASSTWPDLWKWNIPIALFFHTPSRETMKNDPNRANQKPLNSHQSPLLPPKLHLPNVGELSSGGSASSYGDGWNWWRGDDLRGEGSYEDGKSMKNKQLRFGKILSRSKIWTSLGGCLDTRDAIFDTVAGDSQILLKQNHSLVMLISHR